MSESHNSELHLEDAPEADTVESLTLPDFRAHVTESSTPVTLRDWTAQDFSSIYVRFHPHLVSHARRFLINPSQVEEVVQDAFLYLMTSLPELDSELGVFRFLKWKVRLLSLDVIRAEQRNTQMPAEVFQELGSDDPEPGQSLERAEDAAIVSLALAKLQPRHREALIASIYEEKPTETIASEMGISANAFRQLLFRARQSFKNALVGEAEVTGKSASEILGLAARKAASSHPRSKAVMGMVVLAALVSWQLPLGFQPETQELAVPSSQIPSDAPPRRADSPQVVEIPSGSPGQLPTVQDLNNGGILEIEQESFVSVGDEDVNPSFAPEESTNTSDSAFGGFESSAEFLDQERLELGRYLENSVPSNLVFGFAQDASFAYDSNEQGLLHVKVEQANSTIDISLDLSGEGMVRSLSVIYRTMDASVETALVPKTVFLQRVSAGLEDEHYEFWASSFVVADLSGQFSNVVDEDSQFSNFVLSGSINVDSAKPYIKSDFTMESRNSFLAKST